MCDLDNPCDLLGDQKKKKKRIDGAERIDTFAFKMQKNYKSFYFLSG